MEAGTRAMRVAWLAIVVLACGICYSLGFQSGVADATLKADDRIGMMSETLQGIIQANEIRTAAAEREPEQAATHAVGASVQPMPGEAPYRAAAAF